MPDLRLLENLLLSIFRSRIRRQKEVHEPSDTRTAQRDTEEVSHLNSDRLKKLNAWKRDLKAHKAGEKLKEPYDGVRAYHEMSEMDKLLFDVLSDVLEALTESPRVRPKVGR